LQKNYVTVFFKVRAGAEILKLKTRVELESLKCYSVHLCCT